MNLQPRLLRYLFIHKITVTFVSAVKLAGCTKHLGRQTDRKTNKYPKKSTRFGMQGDRPFVSRNHRPASRNIN